MIDLTLIRQFVVALPEVAEASHFDKIAFKAGKKIFATFDEKSNSITVKLSAANQDVFTLGSKGAIYPVPNKWGQQGWTVIDLQQVQPNLLKEAIKTAYCDVVPKKLSALIKFDG